MEPRQSIQELRHIVSVLTKTICDGRAPAGEVLLSIPANPKRDFDFKLMAAIDELESWRALHGASDDSIREYEEALVDLGLSD